LDRWQQERSGYAAIQSTRPQTLAYALADSPVGQLAWNLEWFDDYGHHVGAIDDTLILDNVTLTWLTGTTGSSARLYKESAAVWAEPAEFCPVPTALALFPGDSTSRVLAERQHRVVRFTEYEAGGHFAALQTPDLLARDLQAFFRDLG
jgi:pimeloyl-ACP methyl ester carboxylesterase